MNDLTAKQILEMYPRTMTFFKPWMLNDILEAMKSYSEQEVTREEEKARREAFEASRELKENNICDLLQEAFENGTLPLKYKDYTDYLKTITT